MNASSQNPPGALPPELEPVRPPMPDGLRAAYAAYGVVVPVEPAADVAPASAEDAPPVVTTLQAAAAVMDAAIEENSAATAEQPHVQAAVEAAREQARAEYRAELAEVHTQLAAIAGFRRQAEAVRRLCEGRRGDDLLLVSAVAVAAECGSTALDHFPMTLKWTRKVGLPDGGRRDGRAVVECTSAYGGRADLILTGEERQALASQLDAEIVPDIYASCSRSKACGLHDDEVDADDPALWGWARLDVAGIDDGPAWFCSPACVFNALARAGAELERIEQRAAGLEQIDDAEARYGRAEAIEYGLQVAAALVEDLADEHDDAEGGAR